MSDLISRAEALKYIPPEEPISRMVIAQLPSAEPKHGRWIMGNLPYEWVYVQSSWVCSKCHTGQPIRTKYCGTCGARMDEVEE